MKRITLRYNGCIHTAAKYIHITFMHLANDWIQSDKQRIQTVLFIHALLVVLNMVVGSTNMVSGSMWNLGST